MDEWHKIVEQHGSAVWGIVYRLANDANDANDADDCFQEVFLAAYKVSQQQTVLDGGRLLRRIAYLRGIRLLRDRYRSRTRNVESIDDVEHSNTDPQTIIAAQAAELAEALRHALTTLPDDQAIAHCLWHQEGWSYDEIADQLGVTRNNVGVLLNRARKRLAILLARFNDSVSTRRP